MVRTVFQEDQGVAKIVLLPSDTIQLNAYNYYFGEPCEEIGLTSEYQEFTILELAGMVNTVLFQSCAQSSPILEIFGVLQVRNGHGHGKVSYVIFLHVAS